MSLSALVPTRPALESPTDKSPTDKSPTDKSPTDEGPAHESPGAVLVHADPDGLDRVVPTPADRPSADLALDAGWLLSLRSLPVRVASRVHRPTEVDSTEDGMSTAEYAVGTVAAAGFGGVLYKIITSDAVLELMRGVIARALRVTF